MELSEFHPAPRLRNRRSRKRDSQHLNGSRNDRNGGRREATGVNGGLKFFARRMKRSPFLSFQKPLRVAVVAAERADCAAVRALSSSCCSGIDGSLPSCRQTGNNPRLGVPLVVEVALKRGY